MIDISILEEACNELENDELKGKTITEDCGESCCSNCEKKPPVDKKYERVRLLINDISSMCYSLQGNSYDDKDYGKEDDDLRNELKAKQADLLYKSISRLKEIFDGDLKKEEKKDDDKKEEKDDDKKDDVKEDDDKKKEDEDSDKKDDDKEEKKDDDKEKDDDKKPKETNDISKLFANLSKDESITSPKGETFSIIDLNEERSVVKNIKTGEKFTVENSVLLKWKKVE
jgi:hypothetical protein